MDFGISTLAAEMAQRAKQSEVCSESENKQSFLAQHVLRNAEKLIAERGAERDKAGNERSMSSAVAAFNALTGYVITETQGWLFMVLLKISRSQGGRYRPDDYEDMTAYAALAAESEHKAREQEYPDDV